MASMIDRYTRFTSAVQSNEHFSYSRKRLHDLTGITFLASGQGGSVCFTSVKYHDLAPRTH